LIIYPDFMHLSRINRNGEKENWDLEIIVNTNKRE
jgi:hypothetical protein